jgi:hemerythrin-like domain-containing protein
MNILDGLTGEHAALLTLFEHVEQDSPHMDLERLHETGRLLEHMVMAHSVDEDRYLFDAVPGSISKPSTGIQDALAAMRAEHKQLARDFDTLRGASNAAVARGCLRRIHDLTREHFEVEERVLFQAVAVQIGLDRLEELGAAWKRHRMKEAQA